MWTSTVPLPLSSLYTEVKRNDGPKSYIQLQRDTDESLIVLKSSSRLEITSRTLDSWKCKFLVVFKGLVVTPFSGLFSQILTFSSFAFMPVFFNAFLYCPHTQQIPDVGVSLCDDEQLGPHSDLLCLECEKHEHDSGITIITTRYFWLHPGLKPFGQPLPAQCPDCLGLRTWGVLKKTVDKIMLKCKAKECSTRSEFTLPSGASFVLGRFVEGER